MVNMVVNKVDGMMDDMADMVDNSLDNMMVDREDIVDMMVVDRGDNRLN